jgi:hypothetical protein
MTKLRIALLSMTLVAVWLLYGGLRPAEAQACTYQLGFATIYNLIPNIVGPCRTNEFHDANGNAGQYTANGFMQWRKADNFTAFTNGYQSWVNGPCGLEMRLNTQRFRWEANPEGLPLAPTFCGAPPAPPATPVPTTPPTPVIIFRADHERVNAGDCTTIHWYVENIESVYFEGQPVTGNDSRRVCPTGQSHSYTLEVYLRDGSRVDRIVTVRTNR